MNNRFPNRRNENYENSNHMGTKRTDKTFKKNKNQHQSPKMNNRASAIAQSAAPQLVAEPPLPSPRESPRERSDGTHVWDHHPRHDRSSWGNHPRRGGNRAAYHQRNNFSHSMNGYHRRDDSGPRGGSHMFSAMPPRVLMPQHRQTMTTPADNCPPPQSPRAVQSHSSTNAHPPPLKMNQLVHGVDEYLVGQPSSPRPLSNSGGGGRTESPAPMAVSVVMGGNYARQASRNEYDAGTRSNDTSITSRYSQSMNETMGKQTFRLTNEVNAEAGVSSMDSMQRAVSADKMLSVLSGNIQMDNVSQSAPHEHRFTTQTGGQSIMIGNSMADTGNYKPSMSHRNSMVTSSMVVTTNDIANEAFNMLRTSQPSTPSSTPAGTPVFKRHTQVQQQMQSHFVPVPVRSQSTASLRIDEHADGCMSQSHSSVASPHSRSHPPPLHAMSIPRQRQPLLRPPCMTNEQVQNWRITHAQQMPYTHQQSPPRQFVTMPMMHVGGPGSGPSSPGIYATAPAWMFRQMHPQQMVQQQQQMRPQAPQQQHSPVIAEQRSINHEEQKRANHSISDSGSTIASVQSLASVGCERPVMQAGSHGSVMSGAPPPLRRNMSSVSTATSTSMADTSQPPPGYYPPLVKQQSVDLSSSSQTQPAVLKTRSMRQPDYTTTMPQPVPPPVVDPYAKLTRDIEEYAAVSQDLTALKRKAIVKRQLCAVVQRAHTLFADCELAMTGSSATRFGHAVEADMDTTVILTQQNLVRLARAPGHVYTGTHSPRVNPNWCWQNDGFYKSDAQKYLTYVYDAFRRVLQYNDGLEEGSEYRLTTVEFVSTARMPVIKLLVDGDLNVDITFHCMYALRNTHLLSMYKMVEPSIVQQLVLAVKRWASSNELNVMKNTCRLTSYSLTLMVIQYLQVGCQPPLLDSLHRVMTSRPGVLYPDCANLDEIMTDIDACNELDVKGTALYARLQPYRCAKSNTRSLGELFVGFMRFYAAFDFSNMCVSVRDAQVRPRPDKLHGQSPDALLPMYVEEPFTHHNTAYMVYSQMNFDNVILATFQQSANICSRDREEKSPLTLQNVMNLGLLRDFMLNGPTTGPNVSRASTFSGHSRQSSIKSMSPDRDDSSSDTSEPTTINCDLTDIDNATLTHSHSSITSTLSRHGRELKVLSIVVPDDTTPLTSDEVGDGGDVAHVSRDAVRGGAQRVRSSSAVVSSENLLHKDPPKAIDPTPTIQEMMLACRRNTISSTASMRWSKDGRAVVPTVRVTNSLVNETEFPPVVTAQRSSSFVAKSQSQTMPSVWKTRTPSMQSDDSGSEAMSTLSKSSYASIAKRTAGKNSGRHLKIQRPRLTIDNDTGDSDTGRQSISSCASVQCELEKSPNKMAMLTHC